MSSIGLTSDVSFHVFFLHIINYFVVVVVIYITVIKTCKRTLIFGYPFSDRGLHVLSLEWLPVCTLSGSQSSPGIQNFFSCIQELQQLH